jgi:hypothetical protein
MTYVERRDLFFARLGLLSGFSLMLVLSTLWLAYTILLIFTRGDPQPVENIFHPVQSLVLSLDIVAGALLAFGFWWFGAHHDTIKNQAQNMALAFAIWTIVTLVWRLSLVFMPSEEINPISKRWQQGEFDMFMPHFEYMRVHATGFLLSSLIMLFLMLMLVSLIRNYRVYENFQDISMNRFRAFGLFNLLGAALMSLGWLAFNPASSATLMGAILLVFFVVSWVILYVITPILGLWAFYPAFNIHRSAIETLQFILRRKAEREMMEHSHEGEPVPSARG